MEKQIVYSQHQFDRPQKPACWLQLLIFRKTWIIALFWHWRSKVFPRITSTMHSFYPYQSVAVVNAFPQLFQQFCGRNEGLNNIFGWGTWWERRGQLLEGRSRFFEIAIINVTSQMFYLTYYLHVDWKLFHHLLFFTYFFCLFRVSALFY